MMSTEMQQMREQLNKHYMLAPGLFLDAWKKGVQMACPAYFKNGRDYTAVDKPGDADDKWQLIPDMEAIRQRLGTCSVGEGIFLGAMVSFYNGQTGHEILSGYGIYGLGDVAKRMDLIELKILTALMVNHTGW